MSSQNHIVFDANYWACLPGVALGPVEGSQVYHRNYEHIYDPVDILVQHGCNLSLPCIRCKAYFPSAAQEAVEDRQAHHYDYAHI